MQTFLLLLAAVQLSVLNILAAPTANPDARETELTQQTGHSQILDDDECDDNNYLDDNICQRPNKHTTHSTIIPDDSAQLAKRLEEIDKLDIPLSFSSYSPQHDDQALDGQSSLRQVILIHRHGDRTPTGFQETPKDPLRHEPFWEFHGSGQLTNRGKARMFMLGRIVRERYNEFLGKSVNKNQMISRSSGSLRCIESAQVFLAAFLGLNLQGCQDASKLIWDDKTINPLAGLWQAAGIQSVPALFDGMLAERAQCEKLISEHNKVINSSAEVRAIFNKFRSENHVLTDVMGFKMNYFWKWFWASSAIGVERSYFPDKMPAEIMEVYDSIMDAGALAMGAYQSTLTAKRLRSGLLINDMIRHLINFKHDGHSTGSKKFVHYSAHDLTLVVLLGMFDSWPRFGAAPPDFSSNIVIELHQDQSEWFVRILYMPHVPTDYVELHLDRCESGHPSKRCTLDKFTQLMRPYMIGSWQAWMKECGNDLEKIDPYVEGS